MTDRTSDDDALERLLADPVAHYRFLVEESSDILAIHEPGGRLRWISPSIQRMLGWTPEERLTGQHSLVHPEDLGAVIDVNRRLLAGDEEGSARIRLLHKDGRWIWALSTARAWRDDDGAVIALAIVTHDIDDVVRAEQERSATENLYRLLAENSNDVVLETVDGVIVWVSPSVRPVLGWDPAQLVGQHAWEYMHPDDIRPVQDAAAQVHAGHAVSGRARARASDGTYRWFARTQRPVLDADGAVASHVTGLRDVHEQVLAEVRLQESEAHFRRLATFDQLTGGLNRVPLEESLTEMLSRPARGGRALAVLYVDVDGLRRVNNDHGHRAGDHLLTTVAARLRGELRADDLLARVGGDEFVVVLPGIATVADAEHVADKLTKMVAEPLRYGASLLEPSISIGIALSRSGVRAPDLIDEADQRLMQIKRERRGGAVEATTAQTRRDAGTADRTDADEATGTGPI